MAIVTLDPTSKDTTHPGLALRQIRNERGWTLTEVSRRTGLSISTLSKIENHKLSLSYDKLARLCEGLEVDIARFFGNTPTSDDDVVVAGPTSGRRSLALSGDGDVIDTEHYRYLYPASDVLNKRFIPVIIDVHERSRADFGKLTGHPGEEYVYVLEGCVEVHSDLYTPTLLRTGDSLYFDSGMGHAFVAVGDGPCRLLSICSGGETAGARGRATASPDVRSDAIALIPGARRSAGGS